MQFSHGSPTDIDGLLSALPDHADVSDTTYGDVECFAVTMLDGTAGAPAKLHALRGKLKAAGFSVRSAICALSAVLVQKAPVGDGSTYEPADVDLTACDCGGDCAHEIDDFKSFATCRCCTSCAAPDSVVFDVHAITDDESDVEPYCAACAVEDTKKMLENGWPLESLVLRWLPLSDRALRLAAVAA